MNPVLQTSPPGGPDSLMARAERLVGSGQLETAAEIYSRALSQSPADADLHRVIGLVRLEQGRIDRALFHLGRSIELDPANAVSYRSMGDALFEAGQHRLAEAAFRKACGIDPGYLDAWLNLGNMLHHEDRFQLAAAAYQEALALNPNHTKSLNNLGKVYHDMGRMHQGMSFYQRCLALDPAYAEARFNRAALLLAMGNYAQGWTEYEWRFKRSGAASVYPHRLFSPRWQGESFRGKRLLVHCEQGMGDVLQFARFLPMAKERGGILVVEAHAPLVPLLRTLDCVDEWVTFDALRPTDVRHDTHIPLMSLPLVFGTTPDTIPDTMPYLQPDPGRPLPWPVPIDEERINIGLVWSASDLNPRRNCPIRRCNDWFRNRSLNFIGMQTGKDALGIGTMPVGGAGFSTVGERFRDFNDTAWTIRHLDLVISVDTATAHLAGAMGKPLWVVLPYNADWRWPSQCDCNPWYPTARIFRQTHPGDWTAVIEEVSVALKDLSEGLNVR